MNILLSSFACDPSRGSEAGIGFSWANTLAIQGFKVTCITSIKGKKNIESQKNLSENLEFVFIQLPGWADRLYSKSTLGMYTHYLLWQWKAYKTAKKVIRSKRIDLIHHVSWGSLQLGSFMYKLEVPFIFGPVGGGQHAPDELASYFGDNWGKEKKRKFVSKMLTRFNPACYKSVRKAKAVAVVNEETYAIAEKLGAVRIEKVLDAILSDTFAPPIRRTRKNPGPLKLLWVGRMMPRKGVFLVLDVMEKIGAGREISLTIVGDGEVKKDLDERIKAKNLGAIVNAVGAVPFSEVKKFYEEHDVFFFTSFRDSGPSQLLEAMSFGLPVVTINIHGQRIIVNADRGIKVDVTNLEQTIGGLTDAILTLSNDRQLLERLSINAFEYAKNEAGSRKVRKFTQDLYF